jgi:hypothetical protein
MILPYLYQPQQPMGDVINVHSDHSKCGHKCEKKESVTPVIEQSAPAQAPAKEATSFNKNKKKK